MGLLPCKEPCCQAASGGGGDGMVAKAVPLFVNLVAGDRSVTVGRPQLSAPGHGGQSSAGEGCGVASPWEPSPQGTFQGALHPLCPVVQQLQGLLLKEADARTQGPGDTAMPSGPQNL